MKLPWIIRRLGLREVEAHNGFTIYRRRRDGYLVLHGRLGEIKAHPRLCSVGHARRLIARWTARLEGMQYPTRNRP